MDNSKLASTSSEEPLVQPQRRSQLFSPPASMSPSVSEKYMNFPDEPYLWKFGPEDDNPEDDDGLHYPEESAKATDKESSGPVWTYRGIMNIGFLAILTAAILMLLWVTWLFRKILLILCSAGYPILGYARAVERSKQGGYNIGFINSTGQIAAISGHRGLIDPDTPEEARTRVGYDGKD